MNTEMITFRFYTEEDAQAFYSRKLANPRFNNEFLQIREVEGKGWEVQTMPSAPAKVGA